MDGMADETAAEFERYLRGEAKRFDEPTDRAARAAVLRTAIDVLDDALDPGAGEDWPDAALARAMLRVARAEDAVWDAAFSRYGAERPGMMAWSALSLGAPSGSERPFAGVADVDRIFAVDRAVRRALVAGARTPVESPTFAERLAAVATEPSVFWRPAEAEAVAVRDWPYAQLRETLTPPDRLRLAEALAAASADAESAGDRVWEMVAATVLHGLLGAPAADPISQVTRERRDGASVAEDRREDRGEDQRDAAAEEVADGAADDAAGRTPAARMRDRLGAALAAARAEPAGPPPAFAAEQDDPLEDDAPQNEAPLDAARPDVSEAASGLGWTDAAAFDDPARPAGAGAGSRDGRRAAARALEADLQSAEPPEASAPLDGETGAFQFHHDDPLGAPVSDDDAAPDPALDARLAAAVDQARSELQAASGDDGFPPPRAAGARDGAREALGDGAEPARPGRLAARAVDAEMTIDAADSPGDEGLDDFSDVPLHDPLGDAVEEVSDTEVGDVLGAPSNDAGNAPLDDDAEASSGDPAQDPLGPLVDEPVAAPGVAPGAAPVAASVGDAAVDQVRAALERLRAQFETAVENRNPALAPGLAAEWSAAELAAAEGILDGPDDALSAAFGDDVAWAIAQWRRIEAPAAEQRLEPAPSAVRSYWRHLGRPGYREPYLATRKAFFLHALGGVLTATSLGKPLRRFLNRERIARQTHINLQKSGRGGEFVSSGAQAFVYFGDSPADLPFAELDDDAIDRRIDRLLLLLLTFDARADDAEPSPDVGWRAAVRIDQADAALFSVPPETVYQRLVDRLRADVVLARAVHRAVEVSGFQNAETHTYGWTNFQRNLQRVFQPGRFIAGPRL